MKKLVNGVAVDMSADEANAFQADQAAMTAEINSSILIAKAQKRLDKSDIVALRCFKAGVLFPQEWQDYVTALRAIVNGAPGPLPDPPSYPKGT